MSLHHNSTSKRQRKGTIKKMVKITEMVNEVLKKAVTSHVFFELKKFELSLGHIKIRRTTAVLIYTASNVCELRCT